MFLGPSWGRFGVSLGSFFESGDRLGSNVAYLIIFPVVSESFGDGFSLSFIVKVGFS